MNPILAFLKALPELVGILKELTGAIKSIPAVQAHREEEKRKQVRNKIITRLKNEPNIEERRRLLSVLSDNN